MRRKVWMLSMALIALMAAGTPPVAASTELSCRAPGSLCTAGSDCCSVICTCGFDEACVCD